MTKNEAVERHNQLYDEIMAYMNKGEEPPKTLTKEYYWNFKNNLERYVENGELGMMLG